MKKYAYPKIPKNICRMPGIAPKSILTDYVPFLRVFGLNGKQSRSSEIKNRYIVFFKGSTNMNELKKKS